MRRLRDAHGDLVRERFPDIPRRVSGYNLDSLLPELGFDMARFLVGSESTLVTVLQAELELVPVVKARTLVVMGFKDIATAADAVPAIVEHEPIALEGVDRFLIRDEQLKGMNAEALDELPRGTGFLMVQFGGEDTEESDRRAEEMLKALGETEHEPDVSFLDDPDMEKELWEVRESGLGATAHVPHRADTWEGWEDSAVPVDRLGDYLRDLRALYEEFGYASDVGPSLYGHFGQGCVHTRIPFDLYTTEGVATYRRFMERAADLVSSYGGSLSGEHGDGQSRGELLPRMFGPEVVELFEEVKRLFDPQDRMNPGKIVHPAALDQHLRIGGHWAPRQDHTLFFGFPDDGGSFREAANRCVGVGKCRKHENDGGTVMCPSYQVTHEEEHSTRGRARLLFEMLDGHPDGPITDGWRSTEVRDALDLCLACKGCKSDCPADVDMATYKAEFLAQHYRHRLRPRADYATGWLPVAARTIDRTRLAGTINRLAGVRPLRRLGSRLAGLEDRDPPAFATQTLQSWWAERPPPASSGRFRRGRVLLWPDTFTNYFHPHVGRAAVHVLEDAGWEVEIPREPLCCGLDLDLDRTVGHGQAPVAPDRGRPGPARPGRWARGGVGAELHHGVPLGRTGPAPRQPGRRTTTRPHRDTRRAAHRAHRRLASARPRQGPRRSRRCTATSTQCCGWDADEQLLRQSGVDVEHLDSGCCGLAGNFGFTKGHGEVSEALRRAGTAPTAARRRRRHRRPGRRLLLPHPDRTARQRRAPRHSSCRAARVPSRIGRERPGIPRPGTPRPGTARRKEHEMTTVADYLLERLREWGVEHVFGYPGDGINGILGAFSRADDQPRFIQARHEEMAAFEAVGYAKFGGKSPGLPAVCMATSGPGAVHLLNGLYDAKLDHVPVVAIVGQTNRSAMGGSYQQEVDLLSLFKDVASDYVQMVTVPEQLPNVLDRALRIAMTRRAPTALIIPNDVQELDYSPPQHEFKMVPSSLGTDWPTVVADDAAVRRAADVLNAGSKVAMLVGQGARGAVAEVTEVAELLGAGVAKALLGKDVLSDELPWVTGSIGLLGTRPSYEMMQDCDTLLTIGSSFPYTQFMPELDQARAVQIDIDGSFIGMRYPYEVNLVGDAGHHPARAHPAAGTQGGPRLAGRDHPERRSAGGR